MQRNDLAVLLTVFVATSAAATPAHAYIDAGTGSLILQVLLGGFAGVAVVAKLYWARLRVRFTGRRDGPGGEGGGSAA